MYWKHRFILTAYYEKWYEIFYFRYKSKISIFLGIFFKFYSTIHVTFQKVLKVLRWLRLLDINPWPLEYGDYFGRIEM